MRLQTKLTSSRRGLNKKGRRQTVLDRVRAHCLYREIATLLQEVDGIKEEQEAERRIREERKQGLAELNRVLDQLRIVGKGAGAVVQDSDTLVPEMEMRDADMGESQPTQAVDGEMEEGEERETEQRSSAPHSTQQTSSTLNPYASEFRPQSASQILRSRMRSEYSGSVGTPGSGSPAAAPSPAAPAKSEEDIEMEEGQTREQKPDAAGAQESDELEEGETHSNSADSPSTSTQE